MVVKIEHRYYKDMKVLDLQHQHCLPDVNQQLGGGDLTALKNSIFIEAYKQSNDKWKTMTWLDRKCTQLSFQTIAWLILVADKGLRYIEVDHGKQKFIRNSIRL